ETSPSYVISKGLKPLRHAVSATETVRSRQHEWRRLARYAKPMRNGDFTLLHAPLLNCISFDSVDQNLDKAPLQLRGDWFSEPLSKRCQQRLGGAELGFQIRPVQCSGRGFDFVLEPRGLGFDGVELSIQRGFVDASTAEKSHHAISFF